MTVQAFTWLSNPIRGECKPYVFRVHCQISLGIGFRFIVETLLGFRRNLKPNRSQYFLQPDHINSPCVFMVLDTEAMDERYHLHNPHQICTPRIEAFQKPSARARVNNTPVSCGPITNQKRAEKQR